MKRAIFKRCLSRPSRRIGQGLGLSALAALLLALPATATSSYGFIRTVEGNADLFRGSTTAALEATVNYPIQVGDQILVSPGGRLEVSLPDHNLLRLDGNSQLRLGRLAQSIDTHDDQSLLELLQGQIQIVVPADPQKQQAFRIDTANASLFLLSQGSYRVFTDGKTWTQVIVRSGYAEVATQRGTDRVAAGQQAVIDGDRSPAVTLQAAPPLDALELWGQGLDAEASTLEAQVPYRRGYISPTLTYAAAPLYRHGRWMRYRGADVWRPHVSPGWRPYHSGWWIYTPVGLTWVSTEPWGWVPYHYGYWGQAGGIGWVWYPGHRYTPGAVHWYWGPTHVGWIPSGRYFPTFDSPYCSWPPYGAFAGFQRQARVPGGNWHDWTFSSYERFGFRDNHSFLKTGAELEIPTGILTTDTRNLTPNLWHDPGRLLATLQNPRTSRPRATKLSPLGAAALSDFSSQPPQRDGRSISGTSQSPRPVRQWDPDLWRRDRLTHPQPLSPYRRDTRSSSSRVRGHEAPMTSRRSPTSPRVRSTRPDSSGRGFPGPSGLVRPGTGRPSIGGSRSTPGSTGSSHSRGRSAAPGRSSSSNSGHQSGPPRGDRSMGGGAKGSTSGHDGSG